MSRYGTLAGIVFAACAPAHGPSSPASPAPARTTPIPLDVARTWFAEADALCAADNGALWGRSLCGPMMFADRGTRFVVTNRPGTGGVLAERDGVFVGTLPPDLNIGNTSIAWAGERWTQVMWPLPSDRDARAMLMMHESFHRVQPALGLAIKSETDNVHLDEVDGRYYLQLEWRALAAALQAPETRARDRAVADALAFRAARRRAFPDAAVRENALELHEGLAQYTGVAIGVRGDVQVAAALHDLEAHVSDPSFVRGFAYASGPAYGLLLDRYVPGWRATITNVGDLAAPLAAAVKLAPRGADEAAAAYDGPALRAGEIERAMQRAATSAKYRKLLVDGPVLVLPFSHMKIDFDPLAVMPLADLGSVYPKVRISDDWGVLEVTGGVLVRADWSAAVVAAPAATTERAVPGSWKLDLAPGWALITGDRSGDFRLAKR